MKIIKWNVRGCGSQRKRRSIKEVISKEDLDILVLQEVKKENVDRRFVGSVWRLRFKEWILLPAVGRAGGILLVWDSRRVKVIENFIGDFSVSIRLRMDNTDEWWLSGIYGPPSVCSRGEFWDKLVGLSELCGSKWCLGGDFNIVRNIGEKRNSSSNTYSMRIFDELIRELELMDPPLNNHQFTWLNFRDQPICCRVDRFLVSTGFSELFGYYRQEAAARYISDHTPVILSTTMGTHPVPF